MTEERITNVTEKKWIRWVMSFIGIGMTAIIALVVVIDPFFQYHAPLKNFPYLVDHKLSQNPGMAKNLTYDSVILGSSMTVNFDTDWFAELYGDKAIKLNYDGAYAKDQSNIMKIIFQSHPEVKKVYLGIDIPAYSGGVDETKYPLPEYLYDDNLLNDVSYVFNKDVLLNYIFRPIVDTKDKTDFTEVYASWWTDDYYNKEYVLSNYVAPDIADEQENEGKYIPFLKANMDQNICPYIESHPDTKFVIFYPPYSILYWYGINRENKLKATIAEYQYVADRLLTYDNVELYMFLDQEWIVTDLNHYVDYSHYHKSINRYMTECFGTKECKLTYENLDKKMNALEKMASEYDYDSIWRTE